jgi:hypothetical protein
MHWIGHRPLVRKRAEEDRRVVNDLPPSRAHTDCASTIHVDPDGTIVPRIPDVKTMLRAIESCDSGKGLSCRSHGLRVCRPAEVMPGELAYPPTEILRAKG